MRKPLDIDDVEELEFRARTTEEHRTAAGILLEWAAWQHPDDDDEVTPANLLVYAGEQLSMAGDHEEALAVFRRALAAEGEPTLDVRCYVHHELIETGDVDAARRLADEVRRSKPPNPDVYVFIAGDYDEAGDLAQANRWMNLGLRRLVEEAEDGELSGFQAIMLLSARRRLRRMMGFPPDAFDESPLLPPPIDLPE